MVDWPAVLNGMSKEDLVSRLSPILSQLSEAQQTEARTAQRKLDCLENSILLVHQAAMKMRII